MNKRRRSPKTVACNKPSMPVKLGKRKLWLFRLLSALLLPLLFLAVLEGALRVSGYGYSTRAIVPYDLQNKQVYAHNFKFAWRFFPHAIARYFDGFAFDAQKPPKTYRIFVLGSSAAMGIPIPAYNFGHMLELMLDELYPDMDFEVHTAAMAAINSHAVRHIAKDCARYQPDLFVVYTGNNEVVGPFGPGTVFTPFSPSLPMIRANLAVKATRTGQLLEQCLQDIAPNRSGPRQWTGLEMFLDKQVRRDDPRLQGVYHHFEENLRSICRIAHNAGADIVLSTVASNLRDCPPFASLHRTDLTETQMQTWQAFYQEGIEHETNGRYQDAIDQYTKAAQIDETFADLQFRLGKCCWNTADYQKAKEHYINARHCDTLRFRADNRINEIIRTVARAEGAACADSAASIEQNSPHQVPGAELFYEHVHMTFEGNYTIAATLLPQVQKALPPALTPLPAEVCSIEKVAAGLACTEFDRLVSRTIIYESYLKQPPFTNQLYHDETLAAVKAQIDKQMASLKKSDVDAFKTLYHTALQKRPDDWRLLFQYAAFANTVLKDLKTEELFLKRVLALCPYHLAYQNLGTNLHLQGRLKEAQEILSHALELNPNGTLSYVELASIYKDRNDYEKQIANLTRALSLEPKLSPAHYINLADAWDKMGRSDKAFQALNTALTLFPESETAAVHASLAYFLSMRQDYANALKEMQLAIKIDPEIGKDPDFTSHLTFLQSKVNP